MKPFNTSYTSFCIDYLPYPVAQNYCYCVSLTVTKYSFNFCTKNNIQTQNFAYLPPIPTTVYLLHKIAL